MLSWWHRDVIAAGKLPLMLCFVSFVVTFASTRTITRLIRDGRGPFRNVAVGGTHVHHSVPGIILLMIGRVHVDRRARHARLALVLRGRRGERDVAGARRVRDDLAPAGRLLER